MKMAVAAQILLLVRDVYASKLKYQQMFQQLKEFMRYKQLPADIRKRLIEYYEFRFQKNFYKESAIVQILSAPLRQEIILYSCRRLVESVDFFSNIPYHLLIRIVTSLRSEYFLKGDTICSAGQAGNCMYFIASGTVSICSKEGEEITHLGDGAHFGEIAILSNDDRRVATVTVVQTCELFTLERADFLKAIEPYPELLERIKFEAYERLKTVADSRKIESIKKTLDPST